LSDGGHEDASPAEVFVTSLVMVGIAELFDKTWFMGLLLALKYEATMVFAGSFSALMLHTVLAAAFGYAFARLLEPWVLDFIAAGIFGIFFMLYLKDCLWAEPDSDVIAAGKAEAGEDVGISAEEEEKAQPLKADGKTRTYGATVPKSGTNSSWSDRLHGVRDLVFLKAFVAVFIAEWGDRTQLAMIGQHASQPLVPVFLGSALAFFLLTLSAVYIARLVSNLKISERLVYGISCFCFCIFAILAFRHGYVQLHRRRHPSTIINLPDDDMALVQMMVRIAG
jgi:putative Ca2+/H+ antiporter (TMEM165/GDT1 family)